MDDFNCWCCFFYGICDGGSGSEEYCELEIKDYK